MQPAAGHEPATNTQITHKKIAMIEQLLEGQVSGKLNNLSKNKKKKLKIKDKMMIYTFFCTFIY